MFRIDFNKLRFLVCDDNPHMRRILRTLLHSFGAREVYEAEDGATALEMYSHYVPDIVITDWAMPIFDGLELAPGYVFDTNLVPFTYGPNSLGVRVRAN